MVGGGRLQITAKGLVEQVLEPANGRGNAVDVGVQLLYQGHHLHWHIKACLGVITGLGHRVLGKPFIQATNLLV